MKNRITLNERKYQIEDREAGNVIEKNLTFVEAEMMLAQFIASDKKEGIYQPNFYQIVETIKKN